MAEPLRERPTWEHPIREFFNETDRNHMLEITGGDLDLGVYEHVVSDRFREEIRWRVTSGNMPIPPSPPWSQEWKETYQKWIDLGYPQR